MTLGWGEISVINVRLPPVYEGVWAEVKKQGITPKLIKPSGINLKDGPWRLEASIS